LNLRWPDILSNEDLWEITKQPNYFSIRKRKSRWSGHTLRKPEGSIEKAALVWNPQGAQRCERPRKTWRRSVEQEISEKGKTRREAKRLANERPKWKNFNPMLRNKQQEMMDRSSGI
jgi:hypothetical protein